MGDECRDVYNLIMWVGVTEHTKCSKKILFGLEDDFF